MENDDRSTTKFVTARELSRQTAKLLDAVSDGTRLVVTRHGMPTAVIEATEQLQLLNKVKERAPVEVFEPAEEPIDLGGLDLPEEAFLALDALDRLGDNKDRIIRDTGLGVNKALANLGRLEVHRLITRTSQGYLITRLGVRALSAWREQRKVAELGFRRD